MKANHSAGFSYLEMLVAMTIVLFAMGAALTFIMDFGAAVNTESTTLATQQASRVVLDEMSRQIQQAGYNIRRPDAFNPAIWQRGIVYGGAYVLAFNADIDNATGWLPSTQSLSFPTGSAYNGEGLGATTAGAETYIYTIDADGNNALTTADRSAAFSGSYNPAASTDNPLDFAVFRRVWGFNGTDYGGDLRPLAPYLFTNATTDADYADGTTPAPLFTYWLNEDLNLDGQLADAECINDVIDSCPPSPARDPVLYLWGDSNFDGVLSETEKEALRTLEVGSASWSKNRLASAGAFKSTTLSTAIAPSSPVPYEIEVADGTKLGPGYMIVIGTGGSAEKLTVEQVTTSTTPDRVMLTSDVEIAHAAGSTVVVLQRTLLKAVRAVDITYTSMADKKNSEDGVAVAGRSGGRGSHGLDYKVTAYKRSVEVINAPTSATSPDTAPDGSNVCPLMVLNLCSEDDDEQSIRYTSVPGTHPIAFLVTDVLGNAMSNVNVTFTHSNSSIGALTTAATKSNSEGIATANYTPTGTLGEDTITATLSCASEGTTHTATATNEITFYDVTLDVVNDCLTTVSTRTPEPTTNFTLTVEGAGGPVDNHELELALAFDTMFMPPDPNFSALIGQLSIDGSPVGTTDASGRLGGITETTDGSGEINGSVALVGESSGDGARLNLQTLLKLPTCGSALGTLTSKVDFFKLELDSTSPSSGCTESAPCTIEDGMDPPEVLAELSMLGLPIVNALLDFTATDVSPPSLGGVTAASVLIPANGNVTTDGSGQGDAKVSNNGAQAISSSTPLHTFVDVTSTGDPLMCSSGAVVNGSPRAGFDFEVPFNLCKTEILQANVSKVSNSKICLNIKNANDATDGCSMTMKGIQLTVKTALGFGPDPAVTIKQMKGGGVAAANNCTNTSEKQLFKDDCKSPKAQLANGAAWTYTTFGSCDLPPLTVAPQQYFRLNNIEFNANYPVGRQLEVTVHYQCSSPCDDTTMSSMTFNLVTPP